MSKHTPGPWKIGAQERSVVPIHAETWGALAKVNIKLVGNKGLSEEGIANSLLIAAAPEMADMLLSMYVHVSHCGPTREEAEALLKKAGVL